MRSIIALILILVLSGCSTLDEYKDNDVKLTANQKALVEKEAQSVRGSLEATKVHDDSLAITFDLQALSLLGEPNKPIDISKLKTAKQQTEFFTKFAADNKKLMSDNQQLLKEKAELQTKLEQEAKKQEHAAWVSWIWKMAFSSIGLIGIAGTIALLFFCPALIPVFVTALGSIVGLIVNVFTAIVKEIGVLIHGH